MLFSNRISFGFKGSEVKHDSQFFFTLKKASITTFFLDSLSHARNFSIFFYLLFLFLFYKSEEIEPFAVLTIAMTGSKRSTQLKGDIILYNNIASNGNNTPPNVQYLKRIELSLLPFFWQCSEHGERGWTSKNLYSYIHK